jgi:branched-subunit amino acid aminotransferase/4-amino-4-deoxychorismate lyase
MSYVNYNGKIIKEDEICISPENRAFRYADGFFETMKIVDGKIALKELHFQRLFDTLKVLKYPIFNFPAASVLENEITALAKLNHNESCGRVRLVIFAGNGLINDISERVPNFIIQTYPLKAGLYSLNKKGLSIGFFKDAVKPCDTYSSLKSNNCLPYIMASLWAKENELDDALLLNPYNNLADATIANVFIIKDGFIKTPLLTDGAVNGVMRRYLVNCFKLEGLPFIEATITAQDVLEASEVFLTNAIYGINWVEKIGTSLYTSQMIELVHNKFLNKFLA